MLRRTCQRFLSERRVDSERGVVLVWLALMMVVLLGMGALGIDVAHLYEVKAEAQKAADAAALAGAVYLPENQATGAAQARAIAGHNGFTNVPVAAQDSSRPSQMNVTVSKTVGNFLAGVLGIGSSTVTASASAEYLKPVAMGSPSNQYGNDPDSSGAPGSTSYPNLWGNVASKASPKQRGDAFQAGSCAETPIDNCGSTNTDYDSNGYYYQVHFNQSGTFPIEVFDPGFVQVGDNCPANSNGSNLSGAAGLTAAQVKGWPAGVPFNASARYKPVVSALDQPTTANPGTRYCTGDNYFGSTSQLPQTSYTVVGPATLPGQPSGAPTACGTWSFPGVAGDLAAALQSNTKINVGPTSQFLGTYFRQWFPLCTISGSAGQDYFIQVKGDVNGSGHNRFALRAKNAGSAVSISGNTKMGVYANAALGTDAKFYLARILPNAAGHTLVLSLFDIGDGSGVTGQFQIQAPQGPGESNPPFTGCTYTPPPGTSTGPPFGTFQNTSGNCTVTGVTQAQYNGQWIQVRVPIPSNYTCNFSDPFGCWLKIDYLFTSTNPGQGSLSDTTSWTAVLDGDPVRITK